MADNPPKGMPRITPYVFYKDLTEAVEWLCKVFGFSKRFEMPGPDGKPMHAEVQYEDGVIMMGIPRDEGGCKSPADLPGVNQSLYVYVDDVDAHFAKAKEAGAEIKLEPADMFWGDRMYAAVDLEGHHWSFATHVKDMAPEDVKPDFS